MFQCDEHKLKINTLVKRQPYPLSVQMRTEPLNPLIP